MDYHQAICKMYIQFNKQHDYGPSGLQHVDVAYFYKINI